MAEMTIAETSGGMIGPPEASECAVEPVGVETISPSATSVVTCSPLMKSRISMMRENASREMTTSFSATHCRIFRRPRLIRPQDFRLDHHALDRLGNALHQRVERGAEFVGVDLREEPELAQVHAQQRDARAREAPRRGEDRPVAAEHQREVGPDALVLDPLEQVAPADPRAAAQVRLRRRHRLARPRLVQVRHDQHFREFHRLVIL